MKKLAIYSTLFITLLALTACENRPSNPGGPGQPPSRDRPANPNQPAPTDRDQIQR